MWLFLAFLSVPLIEIALFLQIGGAIGLWPTLAIVVVTAVLGALLVKTQGINTLNNLKSSVTDGGEPVEHLAHGMMIFLAGAFLLTPGFFTDAIGFSLLVPGIRIRIFNALRSRIQVHNISPGHGFHQPDYPTHDPDIIDGDFQEVQPSGKVSDTSTH